MSRTLALLIAVGLFAGAWANDRPASAMARKSAPIPRELVLTEPEWIPIEEPLIESRLIAGEERSELVISVGPRSKTFEVDASQLLIADEVLQAHLDQLPLGLEAGEYRIVDELGGVGWLRVKIEGGRTIPVLSQQNRPSKLISTTVDTESVQFIRAHTATITAGNEMH